MRNRPVWYSSALSRMAVLATLLVIRDPVGAQTEKEEIEKITKIGGKFDRDANGRISRISVSVYAEKYLDSVDFTAFPELESIGISGGGLTAKSIATVNRIPPGLHFLSLFFAPIGDDEVIPIVRKHRASLEGIIVSQTRVTDRTLAEIGKIDALIGVQLQGTKITDKGLKELRTIKRLTDLNLSETAVTDKGLEEVIKHSRLSSLDLGYTEITDDGVILLASLQELRSLRVTRSKVTEKGKKALQQALPNLEFRD